MVDTSNDSNSIFRKESLERLSSPEQLDQLMQVVSLRSWLPLVTVGVLMGGALLWSVLGRIPITTTGRGMLVYDSEAKANLISLAFFPSGEGEQIRPGMTLTIIPDAPEASQAGGLSGLVTQVSPPAMTLAQARQVQGDTAHKSWVEVIATLERDPNTMSGYRWQTQGGDRIPLSPGLTTRVRVTLSERAPIAFVFPFLDRH